MTLGNGVVENFSKNNRLQTQKLTVTGPLPPFNGQEFLSHAYCYFGTSDINCPTSPGANNGNIAGIVDLRNSSRSQNFTYDSLNRLQSFTLGNTLKEAYSIDSFGNLAQTLNVTSPATFGSNNRRTNLPCASSLPTYDAVGNQLCDTDQYGGLMAYTFDAESRISKINSITNASPFVTYTYHGDGTRVRKTNADGTSTDYETWEGQTLSDLNHTGVSTDYIYANGQKIAMLPGKDAVVHTNGTASGNWTLLRWNLPAPQNPGGGAYTVKAGDQLCFRQFANNAYGGPIVWFSNGMSTTWSWNASDGQWLNHMASPQNQWVSRCMDLSGGGQTTGSTITLSVLRDFPTPAGPWDIYYADMSITSADGTVTQIVGSNPTIDPTPYFDGDYAHENASALGQLIPAATLGATAATHFFMNDDLGTAQMEFSSGGWPLWQGQFTPFGQELLYQKTLNNYKFTGKERDIESGLDYFGARYYASNMGRFMSPDFSTNPISIPFARLDNPQTLNLYSYVGNNPLRYFDRYGHSSDCVGGGDPSVVCIVTTAIDKIKSWFSGSGNSSSSGNTQAATPAPSPDPQFRVTSRVVPPSPFTNAPSFYSGSAQLGFASGSISYVPKTKNFFFGPGLAAPPSPGVMFTAGYSRRPEDFLGGGSVGGCGAYGVAACFGVSSSGDGALQLGVGTPTIGGSLGYGLDWNSYTQGLYESIPVNPMATIPGPSGLNVEDPRMGLDPNP